MLTDIFDRHNQKPDKLLRAADQRSGAYSILTGIAGNRSMAEERPVRIDELVQGIGNSDYTSMPTDEDPLPMPRRQK